MAAAGESPIDDEEILYRRVPVRTNWCEGAGKPLSPAAFQPTGADETGLSVGRAELLKNDPAAEARKGGNTSGYYIVELRVGDLRAIGLDVVPCPLVDDESHAEISNLNYGNRKSIESKVRMAQLAKMAELRSIHGPYPGKETVT